MSANPGEAQCLHAMSARQPELDTEIQGEIDAALVGVMPDTFDAGGSWRCLWAHLASSALADSNKPQAGRHAMSLISS